MWAVDPTDVNPGEAADAVTRLVSETAAEVRQQTRLVEERKANGLDATEAERSLARLTERFARLCRQLERSMTS
jgi:hypothetical protein